MGDTTEDTTGPATVDGNTDDTTATAGGSTEDAQDLGEAGKKALSQEREARKRAERQAKELLERVKTFEDQDKTETERLTSRMSELETKATEATLRADRAEVAREKNVPIELLHGSGRDEMAAAADRAIAFAKAQAEQSASATDGLDGGAKPRAQESDPAKAMGAALLSMSRPSN